MKETLEIRTKTDSNDFVAYLAETTPPGTTVKPERLFGMFTLHAMTHVGHFIVSWGPGIAQSVKRRPWMRRSDLNPCVWRQTRGLGTENHGFCTGSKGACTGIKGSGPVPRTENRFT